MHRVIDSQHYSVIPGKGRSAACDPESRELSTDWMPAPGLESAGAALYSPA